MKCDMTIDRQGVVDAEHGCSDVALVGDSPAMASVKSVAETVAARHCTVMVLGQTGTGKELLAR